MVEGVGGIQENREEGGLDIVLVVLSGWLARGNSSNGDTICCVGALCFGILMEYSFYFI